MIEVKKCNYITGDPSDVGFAVAHIVDFLETDGRNALLFTPPRSNTSNKSGVSTSMKYLMGNQFNFSNYDEFLDIINDKSNLFRVDLLVFDFYHLGVWQISDYKKLIDDTGLDHIIIAREYHYKTTDDVNDFHVRREYKDLDKSEIYITDKINNWTSTIKSLSTSYVRDKKIDGLFGKSDN